MTTDRELPQSAVPPPLPVAPPPVPVSPPPLPKSAGRRWSRKAAEAERLEVFISYSKHFTTIMAETRRVRTEAERRAIVAEAMQGHRQASAVARRHGIAPSLLFRWKRLYEAPKTTTDRPASPFIPVTVALPRPACSGVAIKPVEAIEIEVVGGRKLRVGLGIDIDTLKKIIAALETKA